MGDSDIEKPVPPPRPAMLSDHFWNPFPFENHLDVSVLTREVPLYSGRRYFSGPLKNALFLCMPVLILGKSHREQLRTDTEQVIHEKRHNKNNISQIS